MSKKETKVKMQAKKKMQNVFSTKKLNLILLVVRDGSLLRCVPKWHMKCVLKLTY